MQRSAVARGFCAQTLVPRVVIFALAAAVIFDKCTKEELQ
jgi:hypothetical protein